jgi:hypothetical protein
VTLWKGDRQTDAWSILNTSWEQTLALRFLLNRQPTKQDTLDKTKHHSQNGSILTKTTYTPQPTRHYWSERPDSQQTDINIQDTLTCNMNAQPTKRKDALSTNKMHSHKTTYALTKKQIYMLRKQHTHSSEEAAAKPSDQIDREGRRQDKT